MYFIARIIDISLSFPDHSNYFDLQNIFLFQLDRFLSFLRSYFSAIFFSFTPYGYYFRPQNKHWKYSMSSLFIGENHAVDTTDTRLTRSTSRLQMSTNCI